MDRSNLVTASELLAATVEIKNEDRLRKALRSKITKTLRDQLYLEFAKTTTFKDFQTAPSIILNSQRAFIIELVPNLARLKEQRSSKSPITRTAKVAQPPSLFLPFSAKPLTALALVQIDLIDLTNSFLPETLLSQFRDMRYLDLTKLLGGKTMIIPVTFTKNGLSYKVFALLDSKANKSYTLISINRKLMSIDIASVEPLLPVKRSRQISKHKINRNLKINGVSRHAFYMIARQKDVELFFTSLYELDCLISEPTLIRFINGSIFAIDFAAELSELTNDLPIPFEYSDYTHVFSKAASNVLALHKPYDYKIELLERREKALRYSLLYKISILKLKLTKAYLIDNLNKGFIEPLIALFAALVLFAKKQDGSFRFCIDFRALNNLIRKDRYPFLLIDKTFARLLRAKIFTKLDIRQAFYKIRMDPALKELITFRTRYGAYKCKTAVTIEEIAELLSTFRVINQVLKANRTALSFLALRIQASKAESLPVNYGSQAKLIMKGDLLLYDGRLLVLDVQNLRSLLVREVYDQKEFNRIFGTKLTLSTAAHPETNGQTEIYNQYLQKRLRPFLDMRPFFTSRPLKKLDNPTNGPFEVTDNVYSSFKLKLLESIKVHLVFYPGRLRKAFNDSTFRQIILKPDSINITSELEYEVENILAIR
ncbi:polymerase [Drepanopeziza brunnea f. sp. 'multigermtubi' MB_m1]|uniref:Polymerase n=1 Tax=Marssonina brunnea f. sp. multigermtubi (strain MB_m1) TaxID=1072389 RepID=K1WGU6_MARBU|nr:polymerase [Drepanopeziza brunnea f. sp. 'multigermtubi' MB_m1]EKD12066.1 polymerase [Drepanopeziza brunnea f. sp. 'multigermtubi' MB_m1]